VVPRGVLGSLAEVRVSHYLHKIAFEAESNLLPPETWDYLDDLPEEAKRILTEPDAGGPVGLAKHREYGYIVLGCGQGPFIIWSEREIPE